PRGRPHRRRSWAVGTLGTFGRQGSCRGGPGGGTPMLITELIRRGALYHRDRTALLFGDQAMTYGQVDSLSNRVAHVLGGQLGLGKGSPVCLLWDNGLLGMPADFGCV